MPDERLAVMRWQAQVDQLAAGMREGDAKTEAACRRFLVLLAQNATTETIADVIYALADQCEKRMNMGKPPNNSTA